MSVWRQRLRRTALGLGVLAGLGLLGLSGLVLWLRSESGNDFIRRQVDGLVDGLMTEGDFSIGELETDLFTTWTVREVAIVGEDGHALLDLEEARVALRPFSIFGGELEVSEVRLTGLAGDLALDADGNLDLLGMFPLAAEDDAPSAPWEGLPIDVHVERVALERSRVEMRNPEGTTLSVAGIEVAADVSVRGKIVRAEDIAIAADFAVPELARVAGSGAVSWDGDAFNVEDLVWLLGDGELRLDGAITDLADDPTLGLTLEVKPLDLAPIDALAGAGLQGQWQGTLGADGPLNQATLRGDLRGVNGSTGALTVDLGIDLTAKDLPWSGTVTTDDLHVEHVVSSVGEDPLVVSGTLTAAGKGTAWPSGIEAGGDFEGTKILAYGAEVHDSRARLDLVDGQLRWSEVDTDGPLGPLSALGHYDFTDGKVRTTVQGRVNLAELDRFGAEDLGGQADVDLLVKVRSAEDGVPTLVTGVIVAEPFTYGTDVRFERVVADVAVSVRNGRTIVEAEIQGTDGVAYGTEIGVYTDENVRVDVDEYGTVAVGSGEFAAISVPEILYLDEGSAAWEVRMPTGGGMRVEAAVEHGAYDLVQNRGPEGRILVNLADDVAHVEAWMGSGRQQPNLDTSLDFDLRDSSLIASRLLVQPVKQTVFRATDPVMLRLAPEGGGIRDASIHLASTRGRIAIDGDVGTLGTLDGTVTLAELDLGLVSALAELEEPLSGKVDATLKLTGDAADPVLDLSGLAVRNFDGDIDVTGEVQAYANRVYPRLDATIAGEPLVSLGGELPVNLDLADARLLPDESVDLDIALRAGSLDRLERWAGTLPPGAASGAVTLSGTLGDADVRGAGVAELDAAGWQRPARVEWSVERQGDALVYWADVFEGFDRRGELKGTAQTRAEEIFAWALRGGEEPPWDDYDLYATGLDGELRMRQVPASSLFALAGSPMDVEGELEGFLIVGGSATRPVAETAIRWLGGRIGTAKVDIANIELFHEDGTYLPTVALSFTDGGSFFLGGEVPLTVDLAEPDWTKWQSGELDLSMGGEGIPLGLVAAVDPGISKADGMLVLDGTIEGRLDKPEPDLSAKIVKAQLDYLPLGIRLKDFGMELTANERLVSLKSLQAHSVPLRRNLKSGFLDVVEEGPAALRARGSMRIDEWTPGTVNGRIDLDNALLSAQDDQLLRISGGIDISDTWPELNVNGRLKVDQGFIALDSAAFFTTAPLALDENLVVVRRDFSPPGEEEVEEIEPPLYEKFNVGIVFDMNRSVEADIIMPFLDDLGALGASITSADVSVRLDGEGRIAMKGGDLALLGEVEVIGGKARVIQSNFDLTEGTISFVGDDFTNPILDLAGAMAVSGGQVDMRVRGTPSEPQIDFSSEEYPDQQQVFTILLTGRAPDELSEGQGAAAASAAGGLLLQSVLGGTSLGGFSVEPDGTVSVGVPVAPSVFVRSTFSPRPEIDENSVTVVAEWALARKLVLEAAWGDQESWGNLFWELRF
ncbi:MAG: hypothetical protein EP330_28875 [Deltaproteobacteria bacterium]|nr:MAG: hypothetical protein EP330_28875 [Deltaproteobacteria bacterium]